MEQVALNTVIAVMMAIFPGFLFRKFYYRGEFTKQFNQSNEFDKLLWNVFFSGVSMGVTFLSVYAFRSMSGLEVLDSLSYDTVRQIATPIADNKIPDKDLMYKTYQDLLLIIALIYAISCFFGFMLHWLVRGLRLDVHFQLFRFKNYWYYYIHGGKILYSSPGNKKPAFTMVDVLCEIAGETKMYSGILSQYTINKEDNNLENLFLTNARALKQVKNAAGNTVEVKSREIPGAAFCIPYKTVANMNLVYVYRDDRGRNLNKLSLIAINIAFFLFFTFVVASFWFDLSSYGIVGFWEKFFYGIFAFMGLANFRLLFLKRAWQNLEWITASLLIISSSLWILYLMGVVNVWVSIGFFIVAIVVISTIPSSSPSQDSNSDAQQSSQDNS
ncbi:hypothetical protein [Pedobacter kyonggii]|uniref:Uncharacterized protein n=1 Tax=Pedobacter kyonggii TaxID=1926871 RepID=A0A4Q9HBC4_9SPHI|nr:hypothetical protein [Pedobacter kyonggii]TBO41438.1 hypothetical protein EYS08_14490 [Pedobacter kyonggii]